MVCLYSIWLFDKQCSLSFGIREWCWRRRWCLSWWSLWLWFRFSRRLRDIRYLRITRLCRRGLWYDMFFGRGRWSWLLGRSIRWSLSCWWFLSEPRRGGRRPGRQWTNRGRACRNDNKCYQIKTRLGREISVFYDPRNQTNYSRTWLEWRWKNTPHRIANTNTKIKVK